MKKVFIGLLVVAAGTALYFLVIRKKKNGAPTLLVNQEWIIGKWKTGAYQPDLDTLQPKFKYDFREEGLALRSVSDTVKADSLHYAWTEPGTLLLKENSADSTGTVFTVSKLTADSMELIGQDHVTILLTKVK